MNSGGVLECSLGFDGAERDYLGDPVTTPLVGGVADHLAATAVVEVDVDIGHGSTFGVEETLEEQAVLNRVDVGDPERVGHQGPGSRTATRPNPDVDRAGVGDQIRHDQEVRRVPLVADDADLIGDAVDVDGGSTGGEPTGQSGIDLMAQPTRLGLSLGHREDRHPITRSPHVGVGTHPLGDQQGGIARLRNLGVPQCAHLGRGFQVVAVTVELEPIRVRERFAGLHAQQCLVVVRAVAGHVVAVVCGQRGDLQFAAHLQKALADSAFNRQTVVHQFQKIVLRTEDVPPFCGGFQRFSVLTQSQPRLHFAGRTSRGGDDALGMLGDDLGIHPIPLAELALEGRQRSQLEEISQAGGGLGDHRQVGVGAATGDVIGLLGRVAPENPARVEPGSGRHVRLDADNRLDPHLRRGMKELAGTEHVAVIGHADRRHLEALGLGEHRRDLGGTVEQRILGVVVQVHKRSAAVSACVRSRRAVHRPVSLGLSGDAAGRVGARVPAPTATQAGRPPALAGQRFSPSIVAISLA